MVRIRFDQRTWRENSRWIFRVLFLLAMGAFLWVCQAYLAGGSISGSSVVGLSLGVLSAVIILFECMLWPRRRLRGVHSLGNALGWMRAHIWLGLLTLPWALLHSGFDLGGTISTTLMALLIVVYFSGIFGQVLQQFLPYQMIERTPAETVYAEIEHVVGQLRREACRLVASVGHASEVIEVSVREANPRLRPFHVTGQGPQHPKSDARTDDVLDFFERFVEPYLQPRIPRDSPLASASRAENFFSGLRCKADSSAQEAIGALEGLCEQRRQLALQARLHFWLHCWLTVHAPLSFALLFLLMLHAWVAIMYW